MARFNLGETVELRLWVRDDNDSLVTPSAIPTVTVTDPNGDEFLTSSAMVPISTGYYTYKLPTASDDIKGSYQIKFTVTDQSTVSIQWDSFDLGR